MLPLAGRGARMGSGLWSGQRESNPHIHLGKVAGCHYIMPARTVLYTGPVPSQMHPLFASPSRASVRLKLELSKQPPAAYFAVRFGVLTLSIYVIPFYLAVKASII